MLTLYFCDLKQRLRAVRQQPRQSGRFKKLLGQSDGNYGWAARLNLEATQVKATRCPGSLEIYVNSL